MGHGDLLTTVPSCPHVTCQVLLSIQTKLCILLVEWPQANVLFPMYPLLSLDPVPVLLCPALCPERLTLQTAFPRLPCWLASRWVWLHEASRESRG